MNDLGTIQVSVNVVETAVPVMGIKVAETINTLPPLVKTVSGTVKSHINAPAQRKIYAFRRSTGQLIGEVLSSPTTGQYTLNVPNEEIILVALDNSETPLLNDLINRVLPE